MADIMQELEAENLKDTKQHTLMMFLPLSQWGTFQILLHPLNNYRQSASSLVQCGGDVYLILGGRELERDRSVTCNQAQRSYSAKLWPQQHVC